MTEKSGTITKPAGWFSRRHETSEAHVAAVDAYRNKVNENKAPKA